jgi:hypothetical protein
MKVTACFLMLFACCLLWAQPQWSQTRPIDPNVSDTNGRDNDPFIEIGENGTWVAVWVSEENIGGTLGTDGDIFFSRSTDDGATWSAAAPLNDAANDSANDNNVQIETDGNGRWIAAWSVFNVSDFDLLFVISDDDGVTWSAPAFLNSDAAGDTANDFNPTLKQDGNGNWVVAWSSVIVNVVPNDIMVATSSNNGSTWSMQVALNSNAGGAGDDALADLATDGQGNWVAVWQSSDTLGDTVNGDNDIFVARSSNNGMTWSPAAALNSFAAEDPTQVDWFPSVATDGQGNWLTVWSSAFDLGSNTTDFDILVSASSDLGATWSTPTSVNGVGDLMDDFSPRVESDGNGGWLVVWTATQDGGDTGIDGDAFAAFSTDNGSSWSVTGAINTDATTDITEDASIDLGYNADSGRWITVWRGANSSNDDLEIVYALSPPPCSLSANFDNAAAAWPDENILALVDIVTRDCGS